MTCRALTSAMTCAGDSLTGQTLSYDVERNLLQWQNKPTGDTSYTQNAYTGSGDRVWQQVTNSNTTTTTLYLGTAEEIVTTGGTTTMTKYYYAGDRKLAQSINGTITYLVADGLNSVTQALSTTGTVVATQLFAPYGVVRYSQGMMPTA